MGTVADLIIRYEGGDRLVAKIRGHEVVLDQPVADGGQDAGPTPTEMFVAALAGCVGFYAQRYLHRHELATAGLAVGCAFEMAERPARVGEIRLRVVLPAGFPDERQAGLQAVVEHCTVHNSITRAPVISVSLEEAEPRA